MIEKIKWEDVCFNEVKNFYMFTQRLKVDGGYLYHRSDIISEIESTTMCFVPDVDLTRYQSHLRDAYNQGYKDGHEDGDKGIKRITDAI